jgi:hypothetical protein
MDFVLILQQCMDSDHQTHHPPTTFQILFYNNVFPNFALVPPRDTAVLAVSAPDPHGPSN